MPNVSRITRLVLFSAILLTCLGCDQMSKRIATERLEDAEPIALLGGTVLLQYAENPGAFLGLGGSWNQPVRFWLFVGFNAVLLSVVGAMLACGWQMPWSRFVSLSLILAGGIGNLIDRMLFDGVVIDFIQMGIGPLRTGIFNVADVAITTGTLVLIACLTFEGRAQSQQSSEPEPSQPEAQEAPHDSGS